MERAGYTLDNYGESMNHGRDSYSYTVKRGSKQAFCNQSIVPNRCSLVHTL